MTTPAGPRVGIVTPAPPRSRGGNRVTALRWALHLRRLGCRPFVTQQWNGRDCALLLCLHLQKSAASARDFLQRRPDRPLVLVLTGTDIYPEFRPDAATLQLLEGAARVVALQPAAAATLPPHLRAKVRTVVQSAPAPAAPVRRPRTFRACVLANLRPVKDPLLPARAAALLPRRPNLHVLLAGAALDDALAVAARRAKGPHFRWLGPLPRAGALRLLASSHCCILPSLGEGGANVLSEAIAAGTPVLASAIPGNLGLLGADWPGQFPAGDAARLGALLHRAATRPEFLDELRDRTRRLQQLVEPARERDALRALLRECGVATR